MGEQETKPERVKCRAEGCGADCTVSRSEHSAELTLIQVLCPACGWAGDSVEFTEAYWARLAREQDEAEEGV